MSDLLDLLCSLERAGCIFAKIGKSKEYNGAKGDKFPYVVGLNSSNNELGFTFEPLQIAFNYLHYGDLLVLLDFNELRRQLKDTPCIETNSGNPGCFQSNYLYVSEIISIKDKRAIDKLIAHTPVSILVERNHLNDLYNHYQTDKGYYDVICYLEESLKNITPTALASYYIKGRIKKSKKLLFRKKPFFEDVEFQIDFLKYRELYSEYGECARRPISYNDMTIYNAEIIEVYK